MKLDHLHGNPALFKQLALLRRLSAALDAKCQCLGAVVAGSLATDRADQLSDVDLVVYCEAGAAEVLLAELSAVAASAPVVYRLKGRHDNSSVFEKVILEDWSSYEVHVIEPSTRMRLRPPYIELVDRDHYLASRLSDDKPIGRETVKPYANGDEGLVWELFNCMKWLRRGDVAFSKQYLRKLGTAMASP